MTTVEEFLARPLVAHLAAAGPTVRPIWFLWDGAAFWWLTGSWSRLDQILANDPAVALVIDSCDLATGEVLQVTVHGHAEVVPWQREIAVRKLSKYLGADQSRWPDERFRQPIEDGSSRLIRLKPDHPPVLRDLSFTTSVGAPRPSAAP
jgi:nitroimidazol reductase NimA-like FMN-containing flavoprotein (pyridoxamine 5'-phosphate oxidase superfamily)